MSYAIRVPFDGDWLFVTRPAEFGGEPTLIKYPTIDEATEAAKIWGDFAVVEKILEDMDE